MPYRITYMQGNGYDCSCCGEEWIVTENCETIEEACDILQLIEEAKKDTSINAFIHDKKLVDIVMYKDVTKEIEALLQKRLADAEA